MIEFLLLIIIINIIIESDAIGIIIFLCLFSGVLQFLGPIIALYAVLSVLEAITGSVGKFGKRRRRRW